MGKWVDAGWVGGRMDGWGWTDGWTGGQTDGRTGGWVIKVWMDE